MYRFKRISVLAMIVALLLMVSACNISTSTSSGSSYGGNGSSGSSNGSSSNGNTSSGGQANFGHQTKTSGCIPQGGLPDSACTPGAIIASATKDQICTPGYSRQVRNVPQSEKEQDYAEYGIAHHSTGEYEVDHLVSLELGGSNDLANLWPEAANPTPGFHEKDKVENYLHNQVCSGAMSLQDAQNKIATNWLDVYNHMGNG